MRTVRVMEVVWPELLPGIDVVHAAADELGAEPVGEPGLPDPEALVLHSVVALDGEDVRDLHTRKPMRGRLATAIGVEDQRRDRLEVPHVVLRQSLSRAPWGGTLRRPSQARACDPVS